jgi:hypothetical protein
MESGVRMPSIVFDAAHQGHGENNGRFRNAWIYGWSGKKGRRKRSQTFGVKIIGNTSHPASCLTMAALT